MKAHFVGGGFGGQNTGWRGYPWRAPNTEFDRILFCSSEPQLWDFVNDPVGLKGPDGIAAPDKGNVEVPFFDFVVTVPPC